MHCKLFKQIPLGYNLLHFTSAEGLTPLLVCHPIVGAAVRSVIQAFLLLLFNNLLTSKRRVVRKKASMEGELAAMPVCRTVEVANEPAWIEFLNTLGVPPQEHGIFPVRLYQKHGMFPCIGYLDCAKSRYNMVWGFPVVLLTTLSLLQEPHLLAEDWTIMGLSVSCRS